MKLKKYPLVILIQTIYVLYLTKVIFNMFQKFSFFKFNINYILDVEMRTYFNKKSYNNKSNTKCKFPQFYLSY